MGHATCFYLSTRSMTRWCNCDVSIITIVYLWPPQHHQHRQPCREHQWPERRNAAASPVPRAEDPSHLALYQGQSSRASTRFITLASEPYSYRVSNFESSPVGCLHKPTLLTLGWCRCAQDLTVRGTAVTIPSCAGSYVYWGARLAQRGQLQLTLKPRSGAGGQCHNTEHSRARGRYRFSCMTFSECR